MANYSAALIAAMSLSAAGGAAAAAAAPAAPVAAKPALAPTASELPRYVQAPAGSTLTFTFVQEGAVSKGSFKQFTTELRHDENSTASGTLNVEIQTASVDTQDNERNQMLTGADLLDAQKYPTARYVANRFAKTADGGLSAVGKLTLHGVTRDLSLPLSINRSAAGLELSGETAIKRLDYGIGQGDWKSTDSVANEVKIQYKVSLVKAK